jgi:hypothetical protein
MKPFITSLLLSMIIPVNSLAGPADTTIQGILIEFSYFPSIFPEDWQTSPINANGEQIIPAEISRAKIIILKALNKYSNAMLQANLKAVYFLKSMKFFDVGYGGTNSTDAVYVTNNGTAMGYSDSYIEQTFHHEFSSILFRNYSSLLDTAAWKNSNGPGFDYNDPEDGVGAIRNNQSSQELDSLLCKNGFLTQYALSSLENDVNTLAQNLFLPAGGFWAKVDQYPRIRKKVSLLISFYYSIDHRFTEQYFKKFETH